jgi:Heterokaryon incompatibility protein (HET)
VLDISPPDDTAALRILESNGRHAYYASLSYCWGGKQPHMLTAARLAEYCKGIIESTLPQTVRDAVKITRDIGLRYLWIDSYCIIQDCENDKHIEINKMNQIFKCSYVTIVAAGAPAVNSGFLSFEEPSPFWPLPICLPNGRNGTALLKHWPHDTYNAEPISARAWTLQERLLSPRVLWFPSKTCMIEWQCHTVQQSDCGIIDNPFWLDSKFLLAPVFLRGLRSSSPVPIHRLCYKWAEIVECYCLRTLTNPGDKLRAIGGVAAEFHHVWGGDYYAGLWGRFIFEQLLWYQSPTFNEPSTFPSRPNQYRAPSWSWASMDGKVRISRLPYLLPHQLEIVNCKITLADKAAPFGAVLAGSLTVRGLLKKGVVKNSWLYDIEKECGLGTTKMDTIERYRCLTVCCLAVGKKNDEENSASDSDCETLNSQSSYDYPGSSNGLLLLPVGNALGPDHVFRRIGIFEEFYGCNNLDSWFDDCTIQEIIIV